MLAAPIREDARAPVRGVVQVLNREGGALRRGGREVPRRARHAARARARAHDAARRRRRRPGRSCCAARSTTSSAGAPSSRAVYERVAARRADRRDRAPARRDRHRQGPLRARDPRQLAAPGAALRHGRLHDAAGAARRERALRPRARRVHRRRPARARQGRARRGRHALPRRDRRPAARHPGQAAALPPGAHVRARRRPRDARTPTCASCARRTAISSAPSPRGASARTSTTACASSRSSCRRSARAAPRGRRDARAALRRRLRAALRAPGAALRRPRRSRRCARTRGRATCASSSTGSRARRPRAGRPHRRGAPPGRRGDTRAVAGGAPTAAAPREARSALPLGLTLDEATRALRRGDRRGLRGEQDGGGEAARDRAQHAGAARAAVGAIRLRGERPRPPHDEARATLRAGARGGSSRRAAPPTAPRWRDRARCPGAWRRGPRPVTKGWNSVASISRRDAGAVVFDADLDAAGDAAAVMRDARAVVALERDEGVVRRAP